MIENHIITPDTSQKILEKFDKVMITQLENSRIRKVHITVANLMMTHKYHELGN